MGTNNSPQIRFKGFSDGWEQRKLGEVATLSSSKRIYLSDYVTEGIPFYRGSEISTGGITGNQELFISQEKFDEIKEKYGVPSEGNILVTAVGTVGNLWKVDSRRFYYKDGNLIQISKMQVNSDYLLTYFTGGIGKKRLLDSAVGSNQKALTMVKMREITVDFPSEEEQQKIGTFFKTLDETIALRQQKLDCTKKLKKAMLQKMFPKKGSNIPEIRFKGFNEAWEEAKLGDYFVEIRNKGNSNLDFLTIREHDTILRPQSNQGYGNEITDSKKNKAKLIEEGQFLIDLTSYNRGIFPSTMTGLTSNAYTVLDLKFGCFFFWKELLKHPTLTYYFDKITPIGARQGKKIDQNKLLIKKQRVPNIQEQELIGNYFKDLDTQISNLENKLDIYKQFKKAMLQKMFV